MRKMNDYEQGLCEITKLAVTEIRDKKLATKLIKDFVLWKWSERHGKYKGCKHWSKSAFEQYETDGDSNLIHEHVIPRKVLADWLMRKYTNEYVTVEIISGDLSEFCIGCVLTELEDAAIPKDLNSKMPADWSKKDPWDRYKGAFQNGIEICVVNWDEKNRPRIERTIKIS